MPEHDQLLQLIRSLTRNEVNFFLRHVQGEFSDKNKKYVDLFKHFDKHKDQPISLIKESIKDPEILRFFNQYKQYIFDLLVEALAVYARKDFEETEIQQLLNEATFLQHKLMRQAALRRAEKAAKIATEAGLTLHLIAAKKLIQDIRNRSVSADDMHETSNVVNLQEEVNQLTKNFLWTNQITQINRTAFTLISNWYLCDSIPYQHLQNRYNDWENSTLNLQGKEGSTVNELLWIEYKIQRGLSASELNVQQLIVLIQEMATGIRKLNESFIRSNVPIYLEFLQTVVMSLQRINRLDEADLFSTHMLHSTTASLIDQDNQRLYFLISTINTDLLRGSKLEKAIDACEQHKIFINTLFAKDRFSLSEMVLLHKVSVVYYRKKRFKDAYRMNTKLHIQLLEEKPSELRIVVALFMMMLMQIYDKSNYEYTLKNTVPVIEEAYAKSTIAKQFVQTIIEMNEAGSKQGARKSLLHFKSFITTIQPESAFGNLNQVCLQELDMSGWIDSVLQSLEP